jgi:hypothetical protein
MAKRMELARFVILSSPRSGSSLLIESLHQHPSIFCHGEIFHEKIEWHIRSEFLDRYGIEQRDTDPINFAYSILEFANGRSAVGFKMWMSQNKQVCQTLLQDPTVKKIILVRSNTLAMFASEQLAIKTGIWNVAPKVPVGRLREENKARFARDWFLQYLQYQVEQLAWYKKEAVGDVMEVTYVDVANMRVSAIFDFLGVGFSKVEPKKQRLYSADIIGRFEIQSRAEVEKLLADIGKNDWATEEL